MKPSHRRHDRSWRPSPKAWAYRAVRTWPEHFGLMDILKACYPQSRIPRGGEKLLEVPRWAKLAFERHWMSADAYHAVPHEWLGRITVGFEEMFASTPFYGLVRKDDALAQGSSPGHGSQGDPAPGSDCPHETAGRLP